MKNPLEKDSLRDQSRDFSSDSPRCTDCIHYYITHEVRFPHGCRKLGFKSAQSPALVVAKASGQPCLNFVRKALRSTRSGG